MVNINYIREVLLRERNTCLRNLIVLHPKRKRNIPQNQPSKHLNIAKNVVLHAGFSNLFHKMVCQMTINRNKIIGYFAKKIIQ